MNLWKKIKWFLISGAPGIEKPKTTTITIKDLKNKTKKELERIGRKLGIELDRRSSKSKLVNRIKFRAKLKRKK
jgi:hypothetical protein|tara:strand:+ start:8119 stop:8340 length:222 start_codon:yes stop_codon:yes gene_type:complete